MSVSSPSRDRAPVPAPGTMTMTPSGPAGGMHRSTRAAVGVLLVLAILNAAFLYFLPARAATGYAWAIRPPISAAFLGAGYLAGVVATALAVLAARRWRSIQPLAVALVTLSVGLLAATLLHTDRFRWGYPPTWVWTGVYALAPIGVVILARRQRANTIRPAIADPGLRLLRGAVPGPRRRDAGRRDRAVRVPRRCGPRLAVAADAAAGTGRRRVDRDDRGRPAVVRVRPAARPRSASSRTPRSGPGASRCWRSRRCTPASSPAPARRC